MKKRIYIFKKNRISTREIGSRVLPIFLFFFSLNIYAQSSQSNILERQISLQVSSLPIKEVLEKMSQEANYFYSYNSNSFDDRRKISLSVQNQTVRAVLKSILGTQFQFKQFGNNLAILKLKPKEQIIGGYISDEKTGKPLSNVTIYDKKTLTSTTTDSFGYYEIRTRQPIQALSVAREDYADAKFELKSINDKELDIALVPIEAAEKRPIDVEFLTKFRTTKPDSNITEYTVFGDSDFSSFAKDYVETFKRADAVNVRDESLRRSFQWSIAPYLGNNKGLSASVVNNFSINATVGYTLGTRFFELGGIGNINRRNISGLQLSSCFNIVNRKMSGVQISGLINRASRASGLQVAGINNNTDTLKNGLQISGISNQTDLILRGGTQIAGVANVAREGRGFFQAAIFSNRADTIFAQAGLINFTKRNRGIQIGLINISDTASGVMLGLINVVKKGYNKVEISTDELRQARVAFRTGTQWFHTIYGIGVQPIETKMDVFPDFKGRLGHAALGFGSNLRIGSRFAFTLEALGQQYRWAENLEKLGDAARLSAGFNIQIFRKFGISVAPSWNYLVMTPSVSTTQKAVFERKIVPNSVIQTDDIYRWWGWQVGLRIN